MIGTRAFESTVPSIVAASRFAVVRRAIRIRDKGGLRKGCVRIVGLTPLNRPGHRNPYVAPPLRSGCADPLRHRRKRAGRHPRAAAGTRGRHRDTQDRTRRLRPRTDWDRTEGAPRFLRVDGPQAPVRTGAAPPGGVPATAIDPRGRPRGDLDVQESAVDPGG